VQRDHKILSIWFEVSLEQLKGFRQNLVGGAARLGRRGWLDRFVGGWRLGKVRGLTGWRGAAG